MVSEAVEAGDDGGGGKGRLAGLFGVDWGFMAQPRMWTRREGGRRWVWGLW